jgi:hypothetical protein
VAARSSDTSKINLLRQHHLRSFFPQLLIPLGDQFARFFVITAVTISHQNHPVTKPVSIQAGGAHTAIRDQSRYNYRSNIPIFKLPAQVGIFKCAAVFFLHKGIPRLGRKARVKPTAIGAGWQKTVIRMLDIENRDASQMRTFNQGANRIQKLFCLVNGRRLLEQSPLDIDYQQGDLRPGFL